MASLRAAVLDAAEPPPRVRIFADKSGPYFNRIVMEAPDFEDLKLITAAKDFAANIPAAELRDAIALHAHGVGEDVPLSVVAVGLHFYIFARGFENASSSVDMPISRTNPQGLYRLAHNMYDNSPVLLPEWNRARDAARHALLHALHGLCDEETARRLTEALALLCANQCSVTRTDFLGDFLREISGASIAVLGVAAFDLITGKKTLAPEHKLPHWGKLAPFLQKYLVSSGLCRALARSVDSGNLYSPLVAPPLVAPLVAPLAAPPAALLAGPSGELSPAPDQSRASHSKRGRKRPLEDPLQAEAGEVQGQLDELHERMDTVCLLAKTDAACNGDASDAKKAVEALHVLGAHTAISSLVKWSVALEAYSPRCETRFSAVVREMRDELYHLIGARDMAPRGGQVKAWDLAERLDELRDCMEAVCRLSKSGKACDVDVRIAKKAVDSLFEVGLYARASSLKKWSVALDVYPPRHGDHPAFSARVYEMKAELYQLLLSRETAQLVG